jgi:conjugative relaxase-like TrwC/TraI family protein
MAGSLTIGKGASPGYYTEQASRGTDYYAAGAGDAKPGREPEGVWTGDGCPDLGLQPGAFVDHEAFAAIYGSHVDPRDGSRIGRALSHRDAEAIYGRMLDAEPGATAERRAELFTQAQAQAEKSRSVAFFDATFSVSKSITLLHASARAMKLAAEEAGDVKGAAQAQALEDVVWRAISDGAAAGMAHLQAHAGFTRTGAGGVRQEDAHGWIVAQWRQHTSRAGDPQLHVHQTILNKARTERDAGMRTLDGRVLYQERGAASAIGTLVMENALTSDLGVQWVQRDDGHGREIRGVPQALMDEFSTRARRDIAPNLAPKVAAYREMYGHDPDELALWKMGQAVSRENREPKKDEDPARLVRDWAQRAARGAGAALEPLAAQVCGQAQAHGRTLSRDEERVIIAVALSGLQAKRSTFTISDLTRAIAEHLPADLAAMDPEQAAALLPGLAERAISGEAGMVVALTAPEMFTIPNHLRRADGESVYEAHRATRYATDAQMRMEARILEAATERGDTVPHADADAVAQLLGADRSALEAQLAPRAPADVTTVTGSGLLLSQAAAAHAILTSDRRMDVLVGPAGTGKSRIIAAIAGIWPQLHPGGRVIALTETQQGAKVLRDMGVADAHNVSMFLADPRLREIPAGSVVIADEASMVTMGHWDALTQIARQAGAKLAGAGDAAQHGAVQAGGGFGMFARRLGSLQLGEALRFTQAWEREASLRLRAGDQAVIPVYDEQGRILAGTKEEMTEGAYRRWLADYLDGRDSVLIAADNADCRELSRRARADLIRYGRVQEGREAAPQEGAAASAGDRIMARLNTRGHVITNRDIYQVDKVRPDGSAVVRLQLRDGEFAAPSVLSPEYLGASCHLAYGRTSHDVQGSTFAGNGYALVMPGDDRQYLYTALSRGAAGNYAFAVTEEPQLPTGKPVAAPEVGRARMLAAEQAGEADSATSVRSGAGVVAGVLARSEEELSATETLERAFSDADNLAVLSRLWIDLSGGEYGRRYTGVLTELLGEEQAARVSADARYTWLCRTLRAGEMAGMDGRQVLAEAVHAGSLADAASICAVLDHRARQMIPVTLPVDGGWAARAPRMPEPGTERLVSEIGQAMDERTARLGEHVAATLPLWAERDLGPVPDDPAARQDWLGRAAAVEAYREMKDWRSPGDPIGPAPNVTSPEHRAAWHSALMALAKADGIDLSGMSEGQLQARRAQYGRETGQAPAHVGRELRLSRQAREQAAERMMRSRLEAGRSSDPGTEAKHHQNAARWASVRDRAAAAVTQYEAAMETRVDWNRIAEPTLRVARAADLEERRRDPWRQRKPLKSMEPDPEMQGTDEDVLAALGLTIDAPEVSDHPARAAARARAHQARLDEVAAMPEPDADPDYAPGEAWGRAAARQREAVSQPARPMVRPAERVLEPDFEAGG